MIPAVLSLAVLAGAAQPQDAAPAPALVVGVTTHAYYSWVACLTRGLPVRVVPLVPANQDMHHFEPTAEDLVAVQDVQLLVANGIGHDPFVEKMLAAAGRQEVPRVDLHQGVPLIPYHRPVTHAHDAEEEQGAEPLAANPHTWISLTAAIPQIYNLQRALAERLPAHADALRRNARDYARRLRQMKAAAAARLAHATPKRIATVHDGYAYLLQEFGLTVTLVLQPKHGLEPSAREVADDAEALRTAGVEVLFAEADAPRRFVDLLAQETGVPVFSFTHLGIGPYRPESFEEGMQANLDVLVQALVGTEAPATSGSGG